MEKEKIKSGADLLHRLERVVTMITHIEHLEGDLVKLSIGNQGNYPVNSYSAPISREVANEIISALHREAERLEQKIAEL